MNSCHCAYWVLSDGHGIRFFECMLTLAECAGLEPRFEPRPLSADILGSPYLSLQIGARQIITHLGLGNQYLSMLGWAI